MKSQNPRLAKLQELVQLEQRRSSLVDDLAAIVSRMSMLRESLFEDDAPAETSSPSRPAPERQRRTSSRRMGRGQMKEGVLAAVPRAGAQGIGIGDIAKAIGAPYKNVSVWFSTTGRKIANLKKIAPGRYKLA